MRRVLALRAGDQVSPDPGCPAVEVFAGAGVVDHDVRDGQALFAGGLGGHPGAGLVLRQAPARQPGNLDLGRHVDDDDHCEVVTPKSFPPEPFRSLGAAVIRRAIIAKDTAEERGVRPNPLASAIAHLPRRMGYLLGP